MPGKKITTTMVRREYQQQIALFLRTIPEGALRFQVTMAADHYFRACALCVWARGDGVTEAHVEAYNAIVSRGQPAPDALYFEVMSRVAACPSFTHPVFYAGLEECDRIHGTHLVRQFCRLCEGLLLLFAAVDDKLTQEETDYVDTCIRALQQPAPVQDAPAPKQKDAIPLEKDPAVQDLLNWAASMEKSATQTDPPQPEPAAEEPQEPAPTTEELLAELDALCGLEQVKKDVHSMINLIKVRRLRQQNGLPVPPMSLHLVFLGNPGTGKTTVARLLAKIYQSIGVLSTGQLVETDRAGLVAGYVGQTAQKTQEVIQKALGGILFIDEAYALTNQKGENDFGKEAIEILLKNMEDHRDQLIVIVAGYQDLMEAFIHANPGLASRFNKYFYFQDYNGQQLLQIFNSLCEKNGYQPDEETGAYAGEWFEQLFANRDENFGNARDVRNVFEALVVTQSDRVSQMEAPTVEDLMAVTLQDFKLAVEDEEEADT